MAQQSIPRNAVPPPIDQLQGTMNLLLTMLGEALKTPIKLRDPAQRVRVQQIFPQANLRFHDALDRFEDEITVAQAILRRDLALHRVQAQQKAAIDVAEPPALHDTQMGQDEDSIMVDEPVDDNDDKAVDVDVVSVEPSIEPATKIEPGALSPAATTAIAPAQDHPEPAVAEVEAEAVVDIPPTSAATPPKSPVMNGSIAGDLDFGSVFGDSLIADPPNDEAQMNNDFGDSSHDVSSLLPGLESYANIPDDSDNHPMPDVPPQPASAAEEPPTEFDFGNLDVDTSMVEATTSADQENKLAPTMDFGDFDFNLPADDAGAGGGGGGIGEGGGGAAANGDNSFDDLFDVDSYSFGDTQKTEQDLNDWMNSLG